MNFTRACSVCVCVLFPFLLSGCFSLGSLTGTWEGTITDGEGHEGTFTMSGTQEGAVFTFDGEIYVSGFVSQPFSGTGIVIGNWVSMSVTIIDLDLCGATVTGTFLGSEMSGTYEGEGCNPIRRGSLKLTRVSD